MFLFPRFLKKLHPLIHRTYLFFKPAYWRLRTPAQKKFDIKLQYIFIGCFIGVLLTALIIPAAHHLISYPTDETQAHFSDLMTEEVLPSKTVFDIKEAQNSDNLLLNDTKAKIIPITLQLNKNETLSGLLTRAHVSIADALQASESLNLIVDLRKLRPGQLCELFFDEDNTFQGLKMEMHTGDVISTFKNKSGDFIPQSKEGKIETQQIMLDGIIQTSFAAAAKEAGVPNIIIQQVTRALDGEINFRTDLKAGEPFKIIYEKKTTETGKEIGTSQLLYVSLTTNKNTYQRYYFVDGLGVQGFYNEYGESAPQTIMKRPLGRGRISSGFGTRIHPILGYQIHHDGIDFPAPTGTPIPAAADGVIVRLGRNGGYGKYIKIKHNNTYSTAYGHMNAYNKELRVGSYVKRGETIGYVGSTGRSTGPHLHFEVIKNNKQVNPLKTYTLPKRTLKNRTLEAFKKRALEINPDYVYPQTIN